MLRSKGIKIGLDEETLKTFYLMYWCKTLKEKSKTSIVCLLNRRYDQLGAQWEKSLKKKGFLWKIRRIGSYDNLANTAKCNKTTNSKPFILHMFLRKIVPSQPELQHTVTFCLQLHVNSLEKVLSRFDVTMPSCTEKKSFPSLLKNFFCTEPWNKTPSNTFVMIWLSSQVLSSRPQSPASQMLWLKWSKCLEPGPNILWKPSQKSGGCYGTKIIIVLLEWDATCYLCV